MEFYEIFFVFCIFFRPFSFFFFGGGGGGVGVGMTGATLIFRLFCNLPGRRQSKFLRNETSYAVAIFCFILYNRSAIPVIKKFEKKIRKNYNIYMNI